VTDSGDQPHGTVVLTLDARPENLALTRLALAGVAANAGAPRDVVADLKLAVTEACGNAVRHAYGDDSGEVHVSYAVRDDALEIVVEDRGRGLEGRGTPTVAAAGPADGGMGMAIIKTIVDELAIDPGADGRGTVVRMTKRLAPS